MALEVLLPRDIQKMADAPIFERGYEYFSSGLVEDREIVGDAIRAVVRGTEPYAVEVSPGPHFHCSCPFEFSGPCKHVVATLLAYADKPQSFKKQSPLLCALDRKSKPELVAMLVEVFEAAPELALRFGLRP